MAGTITWERKKGIPNKGQKMTSLRNQKEREKVNPSFNRELFHPQPLNVICMQIMKPNNNGRSKTHITHQCNLHLYNRG
jgi:hypothetical protein